MKLAKMAEMVGREQAEERSHCVAETSYLGRRFILVIKQCQLLMNIKGKEFQKFYTKTTGERIIFHRFCCFSVSEMISFDLLKRL